VLSIEFNLRKFLSSLPTFRQWALLPQVLTKKEKLVLFGLLVLFFSSSVFLAHSFYLSQTIVLPAKGGEIREGALVEPRFINPVLASTDTDRDLVELTFSGLLKYDKDGNLIPDLAEELTIDEKSGSYEITLKENIFWSDGEEISADDVVFTIKTIQDSSFKSPESPNWIGVEVKRVSERKISFKLETPYFPFKERLTIKPIPKHIFENIPAQDFSLSSYNLSKAVSSGPYRVYEIQQAEDGAIRNLTLIRNEKYHGPAAYIDRILFSFFETSEDLYRALKKDKIDALSLSDFEKVDDFNKKSIVVHTAFSPRYFGIFFNPENNSLFKKDEVRKALSLSIDREKIVKQAIKNKGRVAVSPILPDIFGLEPNKIKKESESIEALLEKAGLEKKDGKWVTAGKAKISFTKRLEIGDENQEVENLQTCLSRFAEIYPEKEITGYFGPKTEQAVINFQEKYKEDILAPWGFEKGTGIVSETTRKKLNEVCNADQGGEPVRFVLTTVDQPFLIKTAEIVKQEWEDAGFEVAIEKYNFTDLCREKIKTRDYQMLLFGEMLGLIPDPFPFWHSSRINDPGLNLALYENEQADIFLEKARNASEIEKHKEQLLKFEEEFLSDQPALILFSPEICYLANSNIKGIDFYLLADPSKRFQNIEEWYIKTKRTLK